MYIYYIIDGVNELIIYNHDKVKDASTINMISLVLFLK